MSQQSCLTESKAWIIFSRLKESKRRAEVAEPIGVSENVISRIWKHFVRTGNEGKRSSQYGGYNPRLVTELARVRTPNKAWMYLLREKTSVFRL
ncbi:hypothetical protein TNCV_1308611 [Trichonephila clavipes]|nr:hypothetical protein TNCV_1308611 [Trichonephila clavipes]